MTMTEEKAPSTPQPRDIPSVTRQTSDKHQVEQKPEFAEKSANAELPEPTPVRKGDTNSKKSGELSQRTSQKGDDLNEDRIPDRQSPKQSSSKSFGATTTGQSQHQNSSTFIRYTFEHR